MTDATSTNTRGSDIDTAGDFWQARKDFLDDLRYTRGATLGTCAGYRSDLGIWGRWLDAADRDWRHCTHVQVEQFHAWQMRERRVKAHIVARRASCLSSFYQWARKHRQVAADPVSLADTPKRPQRLPVWLDRDEQERLHVAANAHEELPANLRGQVRILAARRRYAVLFGLIQNAGLRISEALGLRVRDVRLVEGVARTVRVIGKGDKERLVPLPDAFGQVFGRWVAAQSRADFVFAKTPGAAPPSPHAARASLQRLVALARIDKAITPHKLRHTYATRLLESGAELVDIQALLGHANLATTQIYTHISEDRMAAVVAKL